ncbi:hypothetical protein [Ktedonospora formicarum]|uniref:Uncharacterized protein n=1 Tax=Ktedonospora formicarum TaxID=2778364 RepID=A0A8J3MTQ3_9CHLR|nr:hypothetical protein [Ktedonospora formicarum]GHO45838.1 hypothetical protein KSX_40010 [Ktedonospora formicarum]
MSEPLEVFEYSSDHALPMSLGPFEAAIKSNARVLGMLYTGSLGRGSADRFSDLDIDLWVTDVAFTQTESTLHEILSSLGTVHFSYPRGAGCTAFVGEEWQRVDLWLHQRSEENLPSEYAQARILKDTDQFLAHALAAVKEEAVAVSWKQARTSIEEATDSQIYLSLHNARGAIWSALGEVSSRAMELYVLLAALRGSRSYGYRYVEHLLLPEEQVLLTQSWPTSPSQQEVRRAAHALWHWTRYVWQEAERCLGRSLLIEIDEAELLLAVDRIYHR